MSGAIHSELPSPGRRELAHAEWTAEAIARFGKDPFGWRFICPVCKHVASVQDYKDAKAPQGAVGVSCIGRYVGAKRTALAEGEGPCDYAGYGLFHFNPVRVLTDDDTFSDVFEFASAEVPA